MALFNNQQQGPPLSEQVMQLRTQGLTDDLIISELGKNGIPPAQIQTEISRMDLSEPQAGPSGGMPPQDTMMPSMPSSPGSLSMPSMGPSASSGSDGGLYERMEEITESLIDEKWDELIGEVKKILDWKNKVEERQSKIEGDVSKLKEDFKVLHEGVLGKLEQYDDRMKDVGTELKAVGKVFKDVIPQFVENVKELGHITKGRKEE